VRCRLHDILHSESRLTLGFEYAEQDLKAYMDKNKNLLLQHPFITKVRATSRRLGAPAACSCTLLCWQVADVQQPTAISALSDAPIRGRNQSQPCL
jgi:hypothetical protein